MRLDGSGAYFIRSRIATIFAAKYSSAALHSSLRGEGFPDQLQRQPHQELASTARQSFLLKVWGGRATAPQLWSPRLQFHFFNGRLVLLESELA